MTPTLKKLLIVFAISLVILIADRISQSDGGSPQNKKIVDKNQKKFVSSRIARKTINNKKKKGVQGQWFKPIPEAVLALSDWGRNPFSNQDPTVIRQVNQSVKSAVVQEGVITSNLRTLKIESVATLGDKTFVIINGQRFQVGDKIDNMRIETIESNRITFKTGSKIIVKNVGT